MDTFTILRYLLLFFFSEDYILKIIEQKSLNNKTINASTSVKVPHVNTFYNVISQSGADPWVYKHTDGYYYMTRTTASKVCVWRSRFLTTINASPCKVVWKSSKSGPACKAIWAPELHFVQSAWYIYFSATPCNGTNNDHRMFVLENKNADPFKGVFTWKGKITDSTDKWAIDGTVFNHPYHGLYFLWSGWPGNVNGRQNLYIAKLSNPWTISSERIEIATPTYPWEINHSPYINEGPQVTIRNEVISLVYSASGSWTNDYCLGLITVNINDDLLKPTSWHKHPEPIFKSANNVFGPGHHSFTTSPDGKEDWIVYHSARFRGAGWIRQVRTQKFTWNADSTPNLGEPAPRNKPIPIPSGEPLRHRYEVEHGRFIHGPKIIKDSTGSNNNKVGYIDHVNSTIIVTIECEKTDTYVIVIRNGNGSAGKVDATHRLSINNGTEISVDVVYSGWNMWGSSILKAKLNQGVNELAFKKGNMFAELDVIDVFLDS